MPSPSVHIPVHNVLTPPLPHRRPFSTQDESQARRLVCRGQCLAGEPRRVRRNSLIDAVLLTYSFLQQWL